MNVGQIVMSRTEAKSRLRDYRNSKFSAIDREYEMAVTAYRALARGTPLVVLSQAFALASLDEKGRPRMAIARADEKHVRLTCGAGQIAFRPQALMHWRSMEARSRRVRDPRARAEFPDGYALVPMVPPDVRGDLNLEKHWILWEVEQWADRPLNARPDRDPLLLRHLGGEAYAVVGQWDLTEVERAIMAGRR